MYEPEARFLHVSCSVDSGVFMRGGHARHFHSKSVRSKLANCVELFDPYLEVWRQVDTTGTPHPGLEFAACASVEQHVYMYGGSSGEKYEGVLSSFHVKTLTWSQLCSEATEGAPLRKAGCGLVVVHGNVAVVGGYGPVPTYLSQDGSSFIMSANTSGHGWTNELHTYNLSQGLWSSPMVSGDRPPPCAWFTLTNIDGHRCASFGGIQPGRGRVDDLYLIDFNAMEVTCTKVPRQEGEPWPAERSSHAACCLGYTTDVVHLLISGGVGRDNKLLRDVWLFNFATKQWREVALPHNGTLARHGHSVTAITLCSGLVDVNLFGGSPDYHANRAVKDAPRMSETTIITFEQHGSEWEMVGVVDNSQRGSSERVRKKMLKMKERAATLVEERQQVEEALAISRHNEKRLKERVKEEGERAELAEHRVQLAQKQAKEAEQRAVATETTAEIRVQNVLKQAKEVEQQVVAVSEVKVQEAQQLAEQKENIAKVKVEEAREQAKQEEQRAIALVKRNVELERRVLEMEERSKRQTNIMKLKEDPSSDSNILNSDDLHSVLNQTWEARSQWYNIGLNLGTPVGSLEAMRRNHRDVCEDCYRTVLMQWFRDHPRPTWSTLADAMRAPSVGMSHIAEQLPTSKNFHEEKENQPLNTSEGRLCCSCVIS